MCRVGGTTATICSPISGRPWSPSPTGPSSPSAGTASEAGVSGCATTSGDSFYYAHFSGYTALARNNHRVHRGEVLGFVGNTGDAFTTEPHLHFEVHPNGLLYLGYDGAVDPTTYLARWQRLDRVQAPPPVSLPSSAGRGQGAVSDFRRLLALRPLERPARPADREAHHAANREAAPAQLVPSHGSAGDSWGAVAAALVLLGAASVAVGVAGRNGRSS